MTNEDSSLLKFRPPSGICFVRISPNVAPSGRVTTKGQPEQDRVGFFGEKWATAISSKRLPNTSAAPWNPRSPHLPRVAMRYDMGDGAKCDNVSAVCLSSIELGVKKVVDLKDREKTVTGLVTIWNAGNLSSGNRYDYPS